MTSLRDAVRQCAKRLERYRQQTHRLGKQNTKAGLIEPMVAALGWDVLDPDEVHREYRRTGTERAADYALLILRSPRLFIEVKGLGENVDDPGWINQAIAFAGVAAAEWVALTDGCEWRVYNVDALVPIEQKLLGAVRLDVDIDAAVELLSLLSKDNMREGRIGELWKGSFVDRQVHAELVELFSGDPAPELVTLLDRRLAKLSQDDIRSSLMRARASFEFPSTTAPRSGRPAPDPQTSSVGSAQASNIDGKPHVQAVPPSSPTPRRPGKQRIGPEERKLHLAEMIALGRLRPGSILVARYFGKEHHAELVADGRVRYGGLVYDSPSGAGAGVKVAAHGPNVPETTKATDGMDFWHTEDGRAGDFVSLKEIRRRAAADLSSRLAAGRYQRSRSS